jgi:glycosyltransferase involved in cell wall biosynthesis
MRALVVSGIWPPDVGGPASHAPEVATFLNEHGWDVEVVTTASSPPAPEPYDVHWVSRTRRPGVRHAEGVRLVAARARRADVVYTTGTFGRSAAGATLARRPYVIKLTADPAFERARRRGLVHGDVEQFQLADGGAQVWLLRRARNWEVRNAAHVFTPSEYLRNIVVAWEVDPSRVSVLPNPAPVVHVAGAHDGPTFAFAGRITAQKALDVALDALARVPDATLIVAGEGDRLGELRAHAAKLGLNGRVRFVGAQSREQVLALFGSAQAALLSSAWENFPHTVVEALAAGTPVIATDVGGVREAVTHGENGLLVPSGDVDALAAAMQRFVADADLRERLRAAAKPSVARFSADTVYGELESVLRRAAA